MRRLLVRPLCAATYGCYIALYLLRPYLLWQVRQLSSATYDRYIQLQKGKRSLKRSLKRAYNGALGVGVGVRGRGWGWGWDYG